MVNYHDPVTIAREFGAYAVLPSFSGLQPDLPVALSIAAVVKLWHVVDGIFMSVSLSCHDGLQALLDYLPMTMTLRF